MQARDFDVYCIAWSNDTYKYACDTNCKILDNRNSCRSDWYESWPIWNFLKKNQLDEHKFYGFLSPKFTMKTGLSHNDAINFSISNFGKEYDIITFSPQPDQAAVFVNVFEHANFYFPGYLEIVDEFLNLANLPSYLINVIMDTRSIVFSNYFFAKPRFWRVWKNLFETLFIESENKNSILYEKLNSRTNYPGGVQHKVFLAEQLASIIITVNNFRVGNYNTWRTAKSSTPFASIMEDMVILDALKIAAKETNSDIYMNVFGSFRDKSIKKIFKKE